MKIDYDFMLYNYKKASKAIKVLLGFVIFYSAILVAILFFLQQSSYLFYPGVICGIYLILISSVSLYLESHNFKNPTKEQAKLIYWIINIYEMSFVACGLVVGTFQVIHGTFPIHYFIVAFTLPFMFVIRPITYSTSITVGTIYLCIMNIVFSSEFNHFLIMELVLAALMSIFFAFKGFYANKKDFNNSLKLTYETMHDQLTGVLNRRAYDVLFTGDYFEKDTKIILVDCDDFKQINDNYGHGFGDSYLLKLTSLLIEEYGRENVYRIGGDEFVVLTDNSKQEILDNFEKVNMELCHMVSKGGVSCGVVATNKCSKHEIENLIDKSLYKAKGDGKRRVEFYNI